MAVSLVPQDREPPYQFGLANLQDARMDRESCCSCQLVATTASGLGQRLNNYVVLEADVMTARDGSTAIASVSRGTNVGRLGMQPSAGEHGHTGATIADRLHWCNPVYAEKRS